MPYTVKPGLRFISDKVMPTLWTFYLNVICCVVFTRSYLKILNSIIQPVFINMVDFFVRLKFTAKMFFHNQPMFKSILFLTTNIDFPISLNNNNSTLPSRMVLTKGIRFSLGFIESNATRQRTELSSIPSIILDIKGFITKQTILSYHIIKYIVFSERSQCAIHC